MGNFDLAVIINGLCFVILGKDYDKIADGIVLAINRYEKHWDVIEKEVDREFNPDFYRDEIKSISVAQVLI